MESVSGEVTLYDLIAWDPRLRSLAPAPESPGWRSLTAIDVDWILAARSSTPMLPSIRGGELIILSDRIVREIGVPFAALMREISSQPIAGILTDHPGIPDTSTGIAVLHIPFVDADTERDLNRLLTNGRRDALQRVADLDQAIAEATTRRLSPQALAAHLSQVISIPITVQTPASTALLRTDDSDEQPQAKSDRWLSANLHAGYTVWLGPIPPVMHAIARFSLGHIREALQRAFDATQSLTPRGSARTTALNTLLREPLTGDREQFAQKAMSAGVPPDHTLRVVRAGKHVRAERIQQALPQSGDLLDAGETDGHHVWLLASKTASGSQLRVRSVPDAAIAVSAPIHNPADLPDALRQATYVSMLLENRLIPGSVAVFEDPSALGIYEFLYPEWESERQVAYRDQHLGILLENDPRGLLFDTLSVYLDHGGSQRLTAESLGIHRNTLAYRLRQITALLAVDLGDPHARLTLHLAAAIHRVETLYNPHRCVTVYVH